MEEIPCTTRVARSGRDAQRRECGPVEPEDGEAAELRRNHREDPDTALNNAKRLPEPYPFLGVRGTQDGRPGRRVQADLARLEQASQDDKRRGNAGDQHPDVGKPRPWVETLAADELDRGHQDDDAKHDSRGPARDALRASRKR